MRGRKRVAPSVGAHRTDLLMLPTIVTPGKLSAAMRAAVEFLAGVRALVLAKLAQTFEGVLTDAAHERSFSRVQSFVRLHVLLQRKSLVTDGARERLSAIVHALLVTVQIARLRERLITLIASDAMTGAVMAIRMLLEQFGAGEGETMRAFDARKGANGH